MQKILSSDKILRTAAVFLFPRILFKIKGQVLVRRKKSYSSNILKYKRKVFFLNKKKKNPVPASVLRNIGNEFCLKEIKFIGHTIQLYFVGLVCRLAH